MTFGRFEFFAPTGKDANWYQSVCHGLNAGNLGLSDGSVQKVGHAGPLRSVLSIKSADTVDGTLRFNLP